MATYFINPTGTNTDRTTLVGAPTNFTELTAFGALNDADIINIEGDNGAITETSASNTLKGTFQKNPSSTNRPTVNYTGLGFYTAVTKTFSTLSFKYIDFVADSGLAAHYFIRLYAPSSALGDLTLDGCSFNGSSTDVRFVELQGLTMNSASIRNCVVRNIITQIGIYVTTEDTSTGPWEVVNNTFYNIGNYAVYIDSDEGVIPPVVIKNNIIDSCTNGRGQNGGVGLPSHNFVYNISGTAFGDTLQQSTEVILTTAPGFVDAAGGDFTLQATSQLIDAGTTTSATTDINGTSRPLNITFDVGAYEVEATTVTYYVSAGGSNTAPYDTIGKAATNLGTLFSNETVRSIDIIEVDGDAGALDPETGLDSSPIGIRGTIRKYPSSSARPEIVIPATSNNYFEIHGNISFIDLDVTINDNVGDFSVVEEDYFSSDITFDSCVFTFVNDTNGNYVFLTDGSQYTGSLVAKNCVIDGLANAAWEVYNSIAGGSATIINNTIYVKDPGGYTLGFGNTDVNIKNNIVVGSVLQNNEAIWFEDCTGSADYNLIYNFPSSYAEYGSIFISNPGANDPASADPLFTDEDNGDFTLQFGSSAIEAGIATSATVDILDNSRPYGANFDIGAYEHQEIPSDSPSESTSESPSESASESPSPSPGETNDSYTPGEELNGEFYGGSYTVPEGAFDEPVDLTINRRDVDVELPGKFINLGVVIETDPEDVQPSRNAPITLVLYYTEQDLIDAGVNNPHKLKVHRWDVENQEWVAVNPSVVDTDAMTVTATVRHLSTFSLGQETSVSSSSPLQAQTELNKIHRVSRKIHPDGITATKCLWVELSDGFLVDVTTGTPGVINKLPFDPVSSSQYESHDKRVGKITTIETDGARVAVNYLGYVTGMAVGDDLVVSVESGEEGKLKKASDAASGTYTVVARCEAIDNINEILVFSISSPRTIVI